MDQTLINVLLGGFCTLLGVILKAVWDSVKDLQRADTALAARVGEVEVLVAGDYVKNSSFDRLSEAIFKKLDKIEVKLDSKADRDGCMARHRQQ